MHPHPPSSPSFSPHRHPHHPQPHPHHTRRPSTSSPPPPPPPSSLTSSTPSPLSSSLPSPSPSASSSPERWVRECLIKCTQLILHARLLSPVADADLPISKTFNLHTPEAGVTHAEWEDRMRGRGEGGGGGGGGGGVGEVLSLDILLSSPSSSASPLLLERWRLHHDLDDPFAPTPPSSTRRTDPTIMFKRMLLLCRSLYSYVRLLPAESLAKQAGVWVEQDLSPPFTLHYTLTPLTPSSSSPSSPSSSSSLPHFRSAASSFSFSAIPTPRGQFTLAVHYLPDLRFITLPPLRRQLPGEVMEDYMTRASTAGPPAPPAARRLSMPAMSGRGGRAVSWGIAAAAAAAGRGWEGGAGGGGAVPHSLPSSMGRARGGSRSNSHTHIESYSPATNTPTFTHGTPPTPSQYPASLTDTPPFTSLPPSPHLGAAMHIPHSQSSPMAIIAPPPPLPPLPLPSPPTHAQSPPIAIPGRSMPHMPLTSRSITFLPSSPLYPHAFSHHIAPPRSITLPPTTGLSLLSQGGSGGGGAGPSLPLSPPPLASSLTPAQRDAELAQVLQWSRALPLPVLCMVQEDGGGEVRVRVTSMGETLQALDGLALKSAQLQQRVGMLLPAAHALAVDTSAASSLP